MSLVDSIKAALLKGYIHLKNRGRHPQWEGELDLPGLQAPVEIRRDARGVPHIFAQNRSDLFFAQGFIHAQDRLWQIEINRLIACGRLSERFGKGAVDTDRLSRTFGFYRQAQQDLELISPDLKEIIEDYARGLNAFLQHPSAQLPVEFALLKYQPDPFTATEAVAFSRLMTFQLSNGWGHELAREALMRVLGPEIAAEFDIRTHPDNPANFPEGNEHFRREPDGRLEAMDGPFIRPMGASNAWVVDGRHSESGHALLANDPHLSALMPSVWYQIYLECPDVRVQGVSLPGIPLVMIGRNDHIAWGLTMAFTDIQDLFIEEFVDPVQYRYRDSLLKAEVVEEVIKVKGEPDVLERVRITRNGPVISGLVAGPEPTDVRHVYALNSPALAPSRITMAWYQMDLARDWDEFLGAMKYMQAPGLNVLYADRKGNIGHWVTGRTPIRKQGRGEVPRPGWTGEYDWVGHIPFEEMPHNYNPKRGWIISANHKLVPDDFPHYLGGIWMNGYRAGRIKELLLSPDNQPLTLEKMQPIQLDLLCPPGLHLAAYYRRLSGGWDARTEPAWRALVQWDGHLTADSVAGTIYEYTRKALVKLLLAPWSGVSDLFGPLVGKGPHAVFFRVSEFQGRETNALFDLLENGDSQVLKQVGGQEKVLRRALEVAVGEMEKDLGGRMENWAWGNIHQLEFRHALAVRPELGRIFNVGPIPVGGDTDTICQMSMQPEEGYKANLASPSYRQLIDMGAYDKSYWVMPPGVSGHLRHGHREDQVEAWRTGRVYPMLWERKSIEKATNYKLILSPKTGR